MKKFYDIRKECTNKKYFEIESAGDNGNFIKYQVKKNLWVSHKI